MEAAGYEVRAFASGAAALAALRAAGADSPDAVVVDVVMPEMDGPSVVRALRGAGWRGQLLWTSGYSPDSAEVPHEAAAFLQKPFTGSELVRAVADTLDSRSPAEDQG